MSCAVSRFEADEGGEEQSGDEQERLNGPLIDALCAGLELRCAGARCGRGASERTMGNRPSNKARCGDGGLCGEADNPGTIRTRNSLGEGRKSGSGVGMADA